MDQLYFEARGEDLLRQIGMTKSEFGRRMGVRKQNVKALFKTKNLETIHKASMVMGVPFQQLLGFIEEPDLSTIPLPPDNEENTEDVILEEEIPAGDTVKDRRKRQDLIMSFYQNWKQHNPDQKRFNFALKEDINIRSISLIETAAQASLSYLSTLAVLQLDAILTNSWLVKKVPSKNTSKNQRAFESILIMEYVCNGIGRIKMTVGVKRSDKTKVQYCITAIDTEKIKTGDQ